MNQIRSTYMGLRNAYKLWSQHIKEENHLRDLGLDDKVILKEVLQK
jgi:hypothetical protein